MGHIDGIKLNENKVRYDGGVSDDDGDSVTTSRRIQIGIGKCLE